MTLFTASSKLAQRILFAWERFFLDLAFGLEEPNEYISTTTPSSEKNFYD